MPHLLLLFIFLTNAQMTQDEILNLVATHAKLNGWSKDTICKEKDFECLKKQIWLDLNSDTMDPKHSHTKTVHATLYKDISATNQTCAIEMKVDPLKRLITAKNKKWNCGTPEPAEGTPANP
jgi:hypothetical protein